MYDIEITDRALKDLNDLPREVVNRIGKKLMEYRENPFQYSQK